MQTTPQHVLGRKTSQKSPSGMPVKTDAVAVACTFDVYITLACAIYPGSLA